MKSLFSSQPTHFIWNCIKVPDPTNELLKSMHGPGHDAYIPSWYYFSEVTSLLLILLAGAFGAILARISTRIQYTQYRPMNSSSENRLIAAAGYSGCLIKTSVKQWYLVSLGMLCLAAYSSVALVNAGRPMLTLTLSLCNALFVAASGLIGGLRGRCRAACIAFILSAWSYLLFLYLVCSIESTQNMLITTTVLKVIWRKVRIENLQFDPEAAALSGDAYALIPDWNHFADIGGLLVALLFGLISGSYVFVKWNDLTMIGNNDSAPCVSSESKP